MKKKITSRCGCNKKTHACKLIVLTGGPGAGKTAILELAQKIFCDHVAVLPEAASIIYGGGFWRHSTAVGRKACQRAIFHTQTQLERVVIEEKNTAVALCDRSTLDGLAYWPGSDDSFFEEVYSSKISELKKYETIIQLRTPTIELGYHQNPIRIESSEEALLLDKKMMGIYKNHPNRRVIDAKDDFMQKALAAIKIIQEALPACCRKQLSDTLVSSTQIFPG